MRPMIVATIASIRPRERALARAVDSILPQVDRLYAYLNGYEAVPSCLLRDKVAHAITSEEAGWRGTECRFFFVDPKAYAAGMRPPQDAIHFPVDDDIEYPPDYVEKMLAAMDRNPGALVCVHASILSRPFESYATSRKQLSFVAGIERDAPAHIPGMGTSAYRLSEIPIGLKDFDGHRACDPVVATICHRRGIPVVSVARSAGWLKPLPTPPGTRLYKQRSAAKNTSTEDELIRPVDWPELSIPVTTLVPTRAGQQRRIRSTPAARFPGRMVRSPEPDPAAPPVHFALIVPGWNCRDRVQLCWQSIISQQPGSYTWEAHVWDDGSTDGTWEELCGLPANPKVFLYRSEHGNLGAAHARWRLIQKVREGETVCALLDLDDRLEPGALVRVANEYRAHPGTLVTFGSWMSEGSARLASDPRLAYTQRDIAEQRFRQSGFRAGHLRTFKRHLADAIDPDVHLKCDGEWLRAGTDAALMYPIFEQCRVGEIRRIDETLYRYWQRDDSAGNRVTRMYRQKVRAYLRSLRPVPVRNPNVTRERAIP